MRASLHSNPVHPGGQSFREEVRGQLIASGATVRSTVGSGNAAIIAAPFVVRALTAFTYLLSAVVIWFIDRTLKDEGD